MGAGIVLLTGAGLWMGGYFTATAVVTALSPVEIKATATGLISTSSELFTQVNQNRFTDILGESLAQHAKHIPIAANELKTIMESGLRDVGNALADNIHPKDLVEYFHVDDIAAKLVSAEIGNFGSPSNLKLFTPMIKASVAAGIVFTKIKATYGYEIDDVDGSNLSNDRSSEYVNFAGDYNSTATSDDIIIQ